MNGTERRFSQVGAWWDSSSTWVSQWQMWDWKVAEWWQSPFEIFDPRGHASTTKATAGAGKHPAATAADGALEMDLCALLPAVQPAYEFRQQLKTALLAAHRQHAARHALFAAQPESAVWPWPVIASVPVVIGIAALIWHRTHRPATQTAKAA